MQLLNVVLGVVCAALLILGFLAWRTLVHWFGKGVPGLPKIPFSQWKQLVIDHREQALLKASQEHNRVFCMEGIVTVSEPALVKTLLMKPINAEKRHPFYSVLGWATNPCSYGVLNMDGPVWKRHTRTMATVFHSKNTYTYVDAMTKAVRDHAEAQISAGGTGRDLVETMRAMSADVLVQWGFGLNPDTPLCRELLDLLIEEGFYVADGAGFQPNLGTVSRYTKHRLVRYKLERLFKRALALKKEQPEKYRSTLSSDIDFLSRMEEDKFTIGEIRAEGAHLYGAHKASGFMLACCLWLLTRNPSRSTADSKWANAVREEAEEKLQGREIRDRSDLEQLPTIELVMNECMRMYPVSLSPFRYSGEPMQHGDVTIPPSPYALNLYALHHDPEFWEDPMTFNPDRFRSPPKPHTFVPFLEGKRMCAGMPLAKLEFAAMITTLLRSYDVEVPQDKAPLAANLYTGFEGPIAFKFVRRQA